MDEFLQVFLDAKLRVKWNTQEELEAMADAVDALTGHNYDRKFMRGYLPRQYGFWGMNGDEDYPNYCLWNSYPEQVCNPSEFLAALEVHDEQDVDVSCLL